MYTSIVWLRQTYSIKCIKMKLLLLFQVFCRSHTRLVDRDSPSQTSSPRGNHSGGRNEWLRPVQRILLCTTTYKQLHEHINFKHTWMHKHVIYYYMYIVYVYIALLATEYSLCGKWLHARVGLDYTMYITYLTTSTPGNHSMLWTCAT